MVYSDLGFQKQNFHYFRCKKRLLTKLDGGPILLIFNIIEYIAYNTKQKCRQQLSSCQCKMSLTLIICYDMFEDSVVIVTLMQKKFNQLNWVPWEYA